MFHFESLYICTHRPVCWLRTITKNDIEVNKIILDKFSIRAYNIITQTIQEDFQMNDTLALDTANWDSIEHCLEVCKGYDFPFFGTNEKGETIMIEDYNDTTLKVSTFQSNDWIRENYYNVEDFTVEEMFSR